MIHIPVHVVVKCLIYNLRCSATGTRTLVSGVRGQRPRPLDDSTILNGCKSTTLSPYDQIFLIFIFFILSLGDNQAVGVCRFVRIGQGMPLFLTSLAAASSLFCRCFRKNKGKMDFFSYLCNG